MEHENRGFDFRHFHVTGHLVIFMKLYYQLCKVLKELSNCMS